MPQCLLVCDLAQLMDTRLLQPHFVMFHGSADKNMAHHHTKRTVFLVLLLKGDRHNESKDLFSVTLTENAGRCF